MGIALFKGDHAAGFTPLPIPSPAPLSDPNAIVADDLNKDGSTDLIVGNLSLEFGVKHTDLVCK